MKSQLSPRELAKAIGASESSLRRWADQGKLRIQRTAGGHRRIPLPEAIRFVRQSRSMLVHPEVLGLDALAKARQAQSQQTTDQADPADLLAEALEAGRGEIARGLITSWYVQGWSVPQLADGPIRQAMQRIGRLWEHGPQGIVVEHRATDLCLLAISHLRTLLPPPVESAPLAVGGGAPEDPYTMPSLLATVCLQELGWSSLNLGPNTPVEALAAAVEAYHPQLIWLSVSSPVSDCQLKRHLAAMAELAARHDAPVLVGGRQINAPLPQAGPNVHFATSMTELIAFAKGLDSAHHDHAKGNGRPVSAEV
jgi:excisionase family DNA binding protein